jgi:hypothetical protein
MLSFLVFSILVFSLLFSSLGMLLLILDYAMTSDEVVILVFCSSAHYGGPDAGNRLQIVHCSWAELGRETLGILAGQRATFVIALEWIFVKLEGAEILSLQLLSHVDVFVERENWSDPGHSGDPDHHGPSPELELVRARSGGKWIGLHRTDGKLGRAEWRGKLETHFNC